MLADTVEPAYRLEILVGVLLGVLTTVLVTMAVLLFFLRCSNTSTSHEVGVLVRKLSQLS